MNKKERAAAWTIDQHDPDNWLQIPDFGVMPKDVIFEGFCYPIVVPESIDLRHRHENIRSLVKLVRSKIRKQFNTLAEVHIARLRVLDALFPLDGSPSNEEEIDRLTCKDKSASWYMLVMGELADATSDFIAVDFPKQSDNAAIRLSEAALWIAQWLSEDAESLLNNLREIAHANSDRGRRAAHALHSRVGGSHDKQQSIRNAWASGKYSSRDLCAEQECAALNMAFGTARRALRNSPEPPRPCAA